MIETIKETVKRPKTCCRCGMAIDEGEPHIVRRITYTDGKVKLFHRHMMCGVLITGDGRVFKVAGVVS